MIWREIRLHHSSYVYNNNNIKLLLVSSCKQISCYMRFSLVVRAVNFCISLRHRWNLKLGCRSLFVIMKTSDDSGVLRNNKHQTSSQNFSCFEKLVTNTNQDFVAFSETTCGWISTSREWHRNSLFSLFRRKA